MAKKKKKETKASDWFVDDFQVFFAQEEGREGRTSQDQAGEFVRLGHAQGLGAVQVIDDQVRVCLERLDELLVLRPAGPGPALDDRWLALLDQPVPCQRYRRRME
jgi:hypothetical protein